MDQDGYDFYVSVWEEDGEWNYSVIQEFADDETEVLLYGTADTKWQALSEVADFIPDLF